MNVLSAYVDGIITVPLIIGILLFILPEKLKTVKGIIALFTAIIALFCAVQIYLFESGSGLFDLLDSLLLQNLSIRALVPVLSEYTLLNLDSLARLIALLICCFTVLIILYSLIYLNKEKNLRNYYPAILLTLGASAGSVLADNLILFLTFWGFLGLTLYKLIKAADEESSAAAKKSLIIVGSSDGIMIFGIVIIWKLTGTLNMSELSIYTSDAIRNVAFITLLIGSFTKAGAFPFHTWIPDYAKNAPASSTAFMPASLDKLLGIYFLARISTNIFILNQWLVLVLMITGVLTIIIGVMMALVQHNFKKLLGYHAVSQVGYMVVGLGLGSPLGIAAGLFHMINNSIYKSGLFLSAGNVSFKTNKEDLEKVGGLSSLMPVTFITSLVFALSISGIPPFNGFASKWMIYQGIIDFGKEPGVANQLWIVWLALAIIGSALTLASFIKFISGLYLGRQNKTLKDVKEVHWPMWLPNVILALVCIVFGVFASNLVIPKLFAPIVGDFAFSGFWNSSAISLLVILSVIFGLLFYVIGNIRNFRTDDSFIGGETIYDKTGFAVTDFYKTINNAPVLSYIYKWADKKWFDIYNITRNSILKISNMLSTAHTGILSNLAFWVLAGLIIMFIILLI
jgi:formate hydrogenlyase subunit 3/multisubunit Na+/H+ antiporter MnhD subunit